MGDRQLSDLTLPLAGGSVVSPEGSVIVHPGLFGCPSLSLGYHQAAGAADGGLDFLFAELPRE